MYADEQHPITESAPRLSDVLTDARVRYVSEEEYLAYHTDVTASKGAFFTYLYDRKYDRDIDPSEILRVAGLSREDFASLRDGIAYELKKLDWSRK